MGQARTVRGTLTLLISINFITTKEKLKPFPILRHLLTAVLLLPLLCACLSEDHNDSGNTPVQIATANQYINLSIVVSTGNENATRADKPAGGEDGDGREAGFQRENEVTGITLMLYEVANENDNLNDLSGDKKLAFIKYYPVTLVSGSREEEGTSYPASNPSQKQIEAKYTTGNQSLEGSQLNLNQKYRALVVANLDMTKEGFSLGSKVADVLEHTSKSNPQLIYNGSSIGATAKEFVMSLESEENTLIKFDNPQTTTNANGQVIRIFEFDNIRIERLAARIDFWTKGATFLEAAPGQGKLTGYEYPVYKTDNEKSKDKFILTLIKPFNLYSGNEYIFKRIGKSDTDFMYLASKDDMTRDEVVLDPNTIENKNSLPASRPGFMREDYWLDDIKDLDWNQLRENSYMTMQSVRNTNQWGNAVYNYTEDGSTAPNIIVGYSKENTLPQDAPLYYYATGLRIEGDYYEDGWTNEETDSDGNNPKVKHLVYYGFLRHEGEGTGSYPIYTKEKLDQKKTELKNTFPMNFGVVRNNIYRVSIDKITEREREQKDPEITLQIKVKKWDKFTHEEIVM